MVLEIGLGIVMLVVVATYAAKIPLSVAVGLGALCKVMHLNPESTFSDQEYAFLLSMKVKVGSLVVFRGRLAWVNWASVTELVFEPIDSAPCQTVCLGSVTTCSSFAHCRNAILESENLQLIC